MTISQALDIITPALAAAGIEDPRREARLLVEHACGLTLVAQLTRGKEVLPAGTAGSLAGAADRRLTREPLAYITGSRGFWTLDMGVSPATLIPRSDTESLIECLCDLRPDRNGVRNILDLGTGTGCLLLAALAEYPEATGCGTDLSAKAVFLASANARRNQLDSRCFFIAADWGTALGGQFDVILCNPPYIPRGDIPGLMPDVARFEPASALDGGPDGLDDYRKLIPSLPDLLAEGGLAVIEAGAGQSSDIIRIAERSGLTLAGIREDAGGIPRAVAFGKTSGHGRRDAPSSVNMSEFP
ncbi:peptide chain release factor N(5)-glutamine methyltransferase [Acetobacter sp. AN02]|uniref:peptide chain release factor N(5)-glutamine methyltransferase n=1 Tax=Acetobacter sp. AN02 TaxID=2894186 RepID=UPI0038CFC879